jgi:molecular chaperone HscB
MRMADDPFVVLGLERRFDVSPAQVAAAHLRTVSRLHPDRVQDPVERTRLTRLAAQAGAAKQVLSDELSRAEVLLEHLGARSFMQASPSPQFLMETMELREAIEDAAGAGDSGRLVALADAVGSLASDARSALSMALAEGDGAAGAAAWVRLRYVARIRDRLQDVSGASGGPGYTPRS